MPDMADREGGAGPAPVEQFFETVELEDGKLHMQVMRMRKQVRMVLLDCAHRCLQSSCESIELGNKLN